MVLWNIHRLFGSAGSPIEHALEGGSPEGRTASEVAAKLDVIAATIDHIARRDGPPLIVGLVEIETADLAAAIGERVTAADLRCVDVIGDDATAFALDGLNITMLVDADVVAEVTALRSHVINRTFNTRDVLECDLTLTDGTPLTVLVNHWPSRLVGEAASQRVAAAHYVRRLFEAATRYQLSEMWDADRGLIDLPNAAERQARARRPVVVMGDLNDEVFDRSVELLGATSDADAVREDLRVVGRTKRERFRSYMASRPLLLNPMWRFADGHRGSYYRSPRWRTYDHLMLSRGLLEDRAPLRYVPESAAIFDEDEVKLPDGSLWRITNGGHKPIGFDLHAGRGCSDHFPVWLQVTR